MTQLKVSPVPIEDDMVDKNGLNSDSIKFAKYYYLNKKEIKRVKSRYDFIRKHSVNNFINGDSIRLWVVTAKIPLLKEMFRIYEETRMEFNDFFQLIMFCCLCPMVSFFNFVLHLIPEYDGKINMNIIRRFLALAGKESECDGMKDLFRHYDINRDGSITFHQFLSILSRRYNSIKNLYTFRVKLIFYIFPEDRYKIILNRKRNIRDIKDYMFNNHDKLISQPCTVAFHQCINGDSHPDKFDYDCEMDGEISFNILTNIIISKYHFVCKSKKGGSLHQLDLFKDNKITYEIDQFYVEYNKIISKMLRVNIPSHSNNPFASSSMYSIDLLSNNGTNTNRTSSSILRCSTYSASNRTSTNTINVTVTPINVSGFKNLSKSSHKEDGTLFTGESEDV